jgi:hypothetical protein
VRNVVEEHLLTSLYADVDSHRVTLVEGHASSAASIDQKVTIHATTERLDRRDEGNCSAKSGTQISHVCRE